MIEAAHQWLIGPFGLVAQLLATIVATALIGWFAFQDCQSAFWKKSDYAYLACTLLAGALGAAQVAISVLEKQTAEIRVNELSAKNDLRSVAGALIARCEAVANRPSQSTDDQKRGSSVAADDQISNIDVRTWRRTVLNAGEKLLNAGEKLTHVLEEPPKLLLLECPKYRVLVNMLGSDFQLTLYRGALRKIEGPIFAIPDLQTWQHNTVVAKYDEILKDIGEQLQLVDKIRSFGAIKNIADVTTIPIVLLGLGIGIRLAKTRFEDKAATKADAEKAAAKADAEKAAAKADAEKAAAKADAEKAAAKADDDKAAAKADAEKAAAKADDDKAAAKADDDKAAAKTDDDKAAAKTNLGSAS